MFRSFFHSVFGNSDHVVARHARTSRQLTLEPLEDRRLLDATGWEGFNDPIENVYPSTEVIGSDAVRIFLSDVNGDDSNELTVVNKNSVSVYYNDGSGNFTASNQTTTSFKNIVTFGTDEQGMGTLLLDVNNDTIEDLVVLTQTNTTTMTPTLTVKVYQGQKDSDDHITFNTTASLSQTLNLRSSSGTLTGNIYVTATSAYANSDKGLVVQVDAMQISSSATTYYDLTTVYGFSSASTGWSVNGTTVPGLENTTSPGRSLLGVVQMEGITNLADGDYYVSWAGDYNLYFTHYTGSNWYTWTLNYGSDSTVGKASINWMNVSGVNQLAGGATISSTGAGIMSLCVTGATVSGSSRTLTASYQWLSVSGEISSVNTQLHTCADYNNDGISDLVFSVGGQSVYYHGETGEPLTFVFDRSGRGSTCYVASTVTTLLGNSAPCILAIGGNSFWSIATDGSGNPVEIFFDNTVALGDITNAVFGDFDNNGYIDVAVQSGTAGSVVRIYIQGQDGSGNPYFYQTSVPDLSSSPSFIGMVAGDFLDDSIHAGDELAVLVTASSASAGSYVYIFTGSSKQPTVSFLSYATLPNAISITAGDITGDGLDELFVGYVKTTSTTSETGTAKLALLKVTSSAISRFQTTDLEIATCSTNDKLIATAGDINGDGLSDLIFLLASSSNYSKLGYALQTTSNTFTTTTTLATSFTYPLLTGLIYDYIDEDGYKDILITSRSASSGTCLLTWLGLDGSSTGVWFNTTPNQSPVDTNLTSSFGSSAVTYGRLFDASNDVALVQGGTVVIWKNKAKSSGSVGTADLFFQNYNSYSVSDSLTTAQGSARTWLDEWSNFYIEIWVTTEGAGDVESFSVRLAYNSAFFTVGNQSSCITATGVTLTGYTTTESDYITITGTASGLGGSSSNVHLISLRFSPTGGVGVPVPDDGNFKSAQSMNLSTFSISSSDLVLNGLAVATVGSEGTSFKDISTLPVYPNTLDINDDGAVGSIDFGAMGIYYGKTRSGEEQMEWCLDFNRDNKVNSIDFGTMGQGYGRAYYHNFDSFLQDVLHTTPSAFLGTSSAALPDALAAVLEELTDTSLAADLVVELPAAAEVPSLGYESGASDSAVDPVILSAMVPSSRTRTSVLSVFDEVSSQGTLPDTSDVDAFLARGILEEEETEDGTENYSFI